ncbi:heat shock factor-binding protein 1-like [Stegodyphus dumicola]
MADTNQTGAQKTQEMKTELNRSASGEPLPDPKSIHDLTQYVQSLLQQMQDKFQIMSDQILARIDDMGHRIDDLEKNIGDLMTQAGVEETDK